MSIFRYKAIDHLGRIRRGEIEAVNTLDLELRLRKLKLDLISYKMMNINRFVYFRRKFTRRDLILFCFHLEQTLRSGVPVLSSLKDLRDSMNNRYVSEVVSGLFEAVEGGETLSEAMGHFKNVFDQVFINLVVAGEKSGELSEVFRKLGANLKWQDEQISQMKRLFTYPAFTAVLILIVLLFLMLYLVPELLKFFATFGEDLPLHTQILIGFSGLISQYWYLFLFALLILSLSTYAAVSSSPAVRLHYDRLKLNFPITGVILRKIILNRISYFFAMMYSSGVTIVDCLYTSKDISGNKVIDGAMDRVTQSVIDGMTLSESFAKADLFPPLVLRMISVGENTGRLAEAFSNISYFYTRDIQDSMEQMQSLIGPVITVFLGSIMAWIIFSVLGPIYDLIVQLKF